MKQLSRGSGGVDEAGREGLAAWLLARLRGKRGPEPRLALVERVTLAPRQSLALVEADGRRFLVATSPEGAPAFLALEGQQRSAAGRPSPRVAPRVSW